MRIPIIQRDIDYAEGPRLADLEPAPPPPPPDPVQEASHYRIDKQDTKTQVGSAEIKMLSTVNQNFEQAKQQAAPGAHGFTPMVLDTFDQYYKEQSDALPPDARPYFREKASALRDDLGKQAIGFEAQSRLAWRMDEFKSNADQWAAQVAKNPAYLAEASETLHAALPHVDPADQAALRDYARGKLVEAGVQSALEKDPQGFLLMLEHKQRKAENEARGTGGNGELATNGEPAANDEAIDPVGVHLAESPLTEALTREEVEKYLPRARAAVYTAQSNQKAALLQSEQAAMQSYRATGKAEQAPGETDFIGVFGLEEGKQRFQALQEAKSEGEQYMVCRSLPDSVLRDMHGESLDARQNGAAPDATTRALDRIFKERMDNPVQAAMDAGTHGIKPLDFTNTQTLMQSLQKRAAAVKDIASDFNVPQAVLSKEEAYKFRVHLKSQPSDEQYQTLAGLPKSLGDPTLVDRAMREISKDDSARSLAGVFVLRDQLQNQGTTPLAQGWGGNGRYNIGKLLLDGQSEVDAARDTEQSASTQGTRRPVALPDETMLRQVVIGFSNGKFDGDPGKMQILTDATRAIAVGLKLNEGRTGEAYDPRHLWYAAELAVGNDVSPTDFEIATSDDQGRDQPEVGKNPSTTIDSSSTASKWADLANLPPWEKYRVLYGGKAQTALFRPGIDDPKAVKVGQIDTHYDKTLVLGITAGIPEKYALAFARHTQLFDDRPGDRPVDDEHWWDIPLSVFKNARTLKYNHFVLSNPVTGEVPEELKRLGPDGKVSDLRPPEEQGTILGAKWEAIQLAMNDPKSTDDEIAEAVGSYLHSFQDTYSHRDKNNVPFDATTTLFPEIKLGPFSMGPIRIGIGHGLKGSNPDYTFNDPETGWMVNHGRNMEMDKAVYERMRLIGSMLEARGNELGKVTPWELSDESSNAKFKDVHSLMNHFNEIPEKEDKGTAENRDASQFPKKRATLGEAMQAWGYQRKLPDGAVRSWIFNKVPLEGGDAYSYI